jgi:hypothetical protein
MSILASGCNGLNAVRPLTHAGTSSLADTARGQTLANKQILVVSVGPPATLLTFPADANGTPTPIRTIAGPNTGLVFAWHAAFLDDGRLWVVNQNKPERFSNARAFSSTAIGNAHPAEIVRCLANMDGGTIGLDAQGFIYVAGVNDNVYVYPPGTRRCVSPVRDITGPHTLLNGPFISVDSTGKVYSANFFSNSVTSYAAGSTGDVSPSQDITGEATGLVNPGAVSVDANGEIFVLTHTQPNSSDFNILVFAPGATGDVAPVRDIKGPATLLVHSTSLAVSSDGWVFVANARLGDGLIAVFAPGANGDVAPTHVINGSNNSFGYPIGVAIQP